MVFRSTDDGQTFQKIGSATIPREEDRNCDEHMLVQRRDGSLLMWVRTKYGIGESTSTDDGKTWSDVAPSSVAHTTSRFFIRRLKSGNLLLIKHGNLDERGARKDLRAFISTDDGKTWRGGLLIDDRKNVSYPDAVESPDGVIYMIYDLERTGDKQILMATFTEADAAAGKAVSSSIRSRTLINQAMGINPGKKASAAKPN
jgi:predicted neuraminidase